MAGLLAGDVQPDLGFVGVVDVDVVVEVDDPQPFVLDAVPAAPQPQDLSLAGFEAQVEDFAGLVTSGGVADLHLEHDHMVTYWSLVGKPSR